MKINRKKRRFRITFRPYDKSNKIISNVLIYPGENGNWKTIWYRIVLYSFFGEKRQNCVQTEDRFIGLQRE